MVDDEPAVLTVLTEVLRRAGYAVVGCAEGSAAIRELERGAYDAIVCDMSLPGMNGVEIVKEARRCDPSIPVVFTSGHSVADASSAALEGGAEYLEKPIEPAVLRASVSRAAAFRRLLIAFEPMVNRDGCVTGYRALERRRERAFKQPGALIGTGEPVERIRGAARAICARALDRMGAGMMMFVNVRSRDLADATLSGDTEPLARHADRVVLEVSDGAGLAGLGDLAMRIRALRTSGYRFAMGGLAGAESAFATFASLEPEFVRLDEALVRDVGESRAVRAFVERVVRKCHQFGTVVIADGIESSNQLGYMREIGCDLFQGRLFGRPVGEL